MILVMTCGCFDILHPGHIQYLQEAKALGCKLIVLLNTDRWIRENKREPIISQEHRKKILEALECVDHVMLFDTNEEKDEIIKDLEPDFWIKASKENEYNTKHDIAETETVESYGGRVIIISSEFPEFSVTELIDRIRRS